MESWFIPGRFDAPHGPLARYRPVQSVGAVEAYLWQFTQPGDLVLDLFCQGANTVREAVGAGRRALGFSINPLLLLVTRLGLSRCEADLLNAAFTRLADDRKGDVPLRRYLDSLYSSPCPACGASGVAEWLAWDRDGDYPFWKAVRCPQCGDGQEGPAVDEDVDAAHRIQPRGLAYYYALDRVAPLNDPGRGRAAQLVELYTPRNLSALMDLTMRLEALESEARVKLVLTGVLLDCFDAGSSLDPYGEARSRPRVLRFPARYIERNVWLCFEEGVSRFLAKPSSSAVHRAVDVAALVDGEAEGYALVSQAAREVGDTVPPESAALIFVDPPRPDGVFWALSALWAGWLWETPAALALRPFLRRRRFDWDWHYRVLRTALRAAGPLLISGTYLCTLFSASEPALLASICLAASGAGYVVAGWGYSPEVGHRMIWRWEPEATDGDERIALDDIEVLAHDLKGAAEQAAVETLRERGEPTGRSTLYSGVYGLLAERGMLARVAAALERENGRHTFTFVYKAVEDALDGASIGCVTGDDEADSGLWWLEEPDFVAEPLADRVVGLVWELLAQRPTWRLNELVKGVYGRFCGSLTPDLALVLMCIDSYSMEQDGDVSLRSEDDPLRRAAEIRRLRGDLLALGGRLGFNVVEGESWDVCWLDEDGRETYVFDVSADIALGRYLFAERAVDEGAQRCLVIPGGRAALVDFRLRRDPRLAHTVERKGWQFVKFRHLRRLLAEEDLDRHAFKTVLGLDPIVEQEAAQIPLF